MHSSGLPRGLVDRAHKGSIEAGKIKPVIGSRHPLRQVPAAVAEIGTGRGRGKVVIRV
jgi:NADPH:quinone reductase-like Zn-dependent oxidoreductase